MAHNVHHFTLATNLGKLSSVFFQINTSQNQPWKLLIRSTSANLHGCFTNTRVSRDNSVLSKSNQPTNQAHCSIQRPNIPHKPVAEMHTQNHAQERVTKSCPHLHTLFHWQGISLSLSLSHTHTHAQPSMLLKWPQETTLSEQYTLHFIAAGDYSFSETHFALCFQTSLQHFHFVVEWSWQKPLLYWLKGLKYTCWLILNNLLLSKCLRLKNFSSAEERLNQDILTMGTPLHSLRLKVLVVGVFQLCPTSESPWKIWPSQFP